MWKLRRRSYGRDMADEQHADERRTVRRIDDPEVLKGLAQPIRQRLWRILLHDGPCTVGTLAGRLDADPGQVSYHLRELAKRGWVERAPELARDRRESWWRPVRVSTQWELDDFPTPEGQELVRHLQAQLVRDDFQRLRHFLQHHQQWSRDWQHEGYVSAQSFLYLRPDEAQAMGAELNRVLVRWAQVGSRAREAGDTAGREPYFHFMYGFPEDSR